MRGGRLRQQVYIKILLFHLLTRNHFEFPPTLIDSAATLLWCWFPALCLHWGSLLLKMEGVSPYVRPMSISMTSVIESPPINPQNQPYTNVFVLQTPAVQLKVSETEKEDSHGMNGPIVPNLHL